MDEWWMKISLSIIIYVLYDVTSTEFMKDIDGIQACDNKIYGE